MVALVSVHLCDVGTARALRMLRGPQNVPGLLSAETALAAPLRSGRMTRPMPGRFALIAFWADDQALDAFRESHPFAQRLRSGWWVKLEPVRAFGDWPGLSSDVPRSRTAPSQEPAVVLTLGRLRLRRVRSFLRASRPAEAAAVGAEGFLWGTALARPPFVSTLSVWESARAAAAYAYASGGGAHPGAIDADRRRPFHHRSAFIRSVPLESDGSLAGRNPLAANVNRFGRAEAPRARRQ
jgi:hypothetical protein